MKVTIDEKLNKLSVIIENKKVNLFLLIVLLIFTILSIIGFFSLIIMQGINENSAIGIIIFALISYYFLRLFLWNWKGKEIVEITEKEITQIIDYWLYKETTIIDNKEVELLFWRENQDEAINYQNLTLDDESIDNLNLNKIKIQSKREEFEKIYINGNLNQEEVETIMRKLNS